MARPPDRLLLAVIPALVLAVAGLQHQRAHTVDQSSWSGAGFGMFATYESEQTRFVVLRLGGPGGERVAVPGGVSRQVLEAQVVPSDDRLVALGRAARRLLGVAPGEPIAVELWGITFDPGSAAVGRTLLAEVEVSGR